LLTGRVNATVLNFTIDPQQSTFRFALETTDGTQFTGPQTAGSDTTVASGTALIDVTPTSIQFLTTADTQFALQTLPQAPLPGGSAGTAPAQLGLSVALAGIVSGVVAARGYVGDATSPVIPLVGVAFDASQVTLDLPAGDTDYNLNFSGFPVSGSVTENFPALNTLTGGSLTLVGGIYTMTLPLLVKGSITISGVAIVPVYSGVIVATAPVPEPGGPLLAAIGMVALLFARRRHR
jgi:MYXO-CTERM domain-containing protein